MLHWTTLAWLLLVHKVHLSTAALSPVCDVTREAGVKYIDIRLPELEVPAELTTYTCYTQRIPLDLKVAYHAVAFEPIIMNTAVMHHMLLFGCTEPNYDTPHACSEADAACGNFLVQWSMGIEGQICSYPDTGVRFGHNSFKSLALQIHWNNANLTQGMTDSSGVRVYYTTHLRGFDLANVQVGQDDLQIPPGVAHFAQTGSCSSNCSRRLLTSPIYLTRAHIHMHYVGDGGHLQLIRDGETIRTIINDTQFDYNNPSAHYFEPAVQVLPGDELRLTCYFNTRDGLKRRTGTVYWGMGSDGEMCYAFITYFPFITSMSRCVQFDRHDICPANAPTVVEVGGCVFNGFIQSFETFLANDILDACGAPPIGQSDGKASSVRLAVLCSEKCESTIELMKAHPCFQGRVGHQLRRVYLPTTSSWEKVKVILEASSKYCTD